MKKLIIGLVSCLMVLPTMAQSPYIFNYQGLARDGQGVALNNQEISVLISIISGFEDGPIEFQEEHVVTTSDHGIFNLAIGDGDFFTGNLRNIDWGSDQFFIRTEIDPTGGEDYIDLGAAQLFSVPFALYALESGSGGGEGSQEIFFDGENLSISNGNTVDLSSLQKDEDSDPENELQSLSLDGNNLTISGGNTITLAGASTESVWEEDDQGIYYRGSSASLQTDEGKNTVRIARSSNGSGIVDVYGQDDNEKVELLTTSNNSGLIRTKGPNQQPNIILSARSDNADNGSLSIYDENGATKVDLFVSTTGRGGVVTRGANGNSNVSLTALGDNVNHGFITVSDSEGNSQAGVYVDASGNGRVFADFVDTFVDNPDHTRSDKRIIYSMIQGPEAAAYLRGTSRLENGETKIKFPNHFSNLIDQKGLTVMITPLSAISKGIAVIQKNNKGFNAKELFDGKGNYDFDWEVKGIRKENHYRKHPDLQIKDINRKDDQ